MVTLSFQGIQDLMTEEGFRLKPYKDSKGNWTIGVGHLILPTENYLLNPAGITKEKATELLKADVLKVERAIDRRVRVPLQQHQIDALVSLLFNVGDNGAGTLINLINANASPQAIYNRWTTTYLNDDDIMLSEDLFLSLSENLSDGLLEARRIREAQKFTGVDSSPTVINSITNVQPAIVDNTQTSVPKPNLTLTPEQQAYLNVTGGRGVVPGKPRVTTGQPLPGTASYGSQQGASATDSGTMTKIAIGLFAVVVLKKSGFLDKMFKNKRR